MGRLLPDASPPLYSRETTRVGLPLVESLPLSSLEMTSGRSPPLKSL